MNKLLMIVNIPKNRKIIFVCLFSFVSFILDERMISPTPNTSPIKGTKMNFSIRIRI